MSVLNDRQIMTLGLCGLLEPFEPELVNPASIDTRIGNTLKAERSDGSWALVDLTLHSKDHPYWLQPKEFVLVASLETFNIPDNCVGEWRIKSSRAREGYNNILAVHLDPGWNGSKLTMELINERYNARLPLYPGLKIGQLILHSCEPPDASYAITGRYNNDTTVMGSKG